MTQIRETAGNFEGAQKRVGLVAARFNSRIVDGLVQSAVDCLLRHSVSPDAIEIVRVPGAWELPLALDELARSGKFDLLVALGAVVRGETPHFDYVCGETSSGIARVSLQNRLPIGFGLLTCENSEQGRQRSGGKAGNKGWEAAAAALEMADLLQRLRS
ncbi:MAG: 6,7-dimethyl-8-ribityllumazine synthase [Deltaproteobacteria bacterium]|nr:6,7-dimethyl-8-ribityllumazine synthase [Deltaproteobacteria bacterium]